MDAKHGQRELIAAIQRGDHKAMEAFYHRYARAMFNTAYRITGDYHYAEDVVQEAFIKAFAHMKNFRGDAEPGAWLKRIVINESLQWLRKFRRFETDREPPENSTPPDDDDDDIFADRALRQALARALLRLRTNYRTVLSLHYIEGYDLQETAQIMGISYGNVRTMLTRAKQQLKKLMENERTTH